MVLKSGQTSFDMGHRALKQYSDANAHLLGLVVNGLDVKKGDDYYNTYYNAYTEEVEAG